jgi:hypothetical protein
LLLLLLLLLLPQHGTFQALKGVAPLVAVSGVSRVPITLIPAAAVAAAAAALFITAEKSCTQHCKA